MGLITKEVEITLNDRVIKWYEDKGYEIPRYYNKKNNKMLVKKGTKIIVKVEDLTDSSKSLIDVQCDRCGEILNRPWADYKKYVHEDGKYYCKKCATNLFAVKKHKETKLANGKSFEQWCIENDKLDVLNYWDYELNDCKPSEINYSTHEKYWFKCPRGLHKSELKCINTFTMRQEKNIRCNKCNSFAQYNIDKIGEVFFTKYWDFERNILNPWEINYGSQNIEVWIKCQEKDYHGSYKISCYCFSSGVRCPYCGKLETHLLDSLGTLYPQVFNIWDEINKKSPNDYSPGSEQCVWWKCENSKHKHYYRSIKASKNAEFRCPECVQERDESFLQEKVRLFLETLYYTILHEYKCTIIPVNPKTKNRLPFDNEIKELKLIIEVMGQQHYKISNFHVLQAKYNNTTPEYELYMQKVRDRYKRILAKKQEYFYLEIPYWTDDKDETWKKLIDEKIEYIKRSIRR